MQGGNHSALLQLRRKVGRSVGYDLVLLAHIDSTSTSVQKSDIRRDWEGTRQLVVTCQPQVSYQLVVDVSTSLLFRGRQ